MGFTRNDELKLDSMGISLTGTYYTFRGECTIRKQLQGSTMKYFISGNLQVYASKQHYIDGKNPIPVSHTYSGMNSMGPQSFGVYLTTLTDKEPMTELYAGTKTALSLTDITDDL
jgi:hypothetical protein